MVSNDALFSPPIYRSAEFYMLRAPALPAKIFFQLTTLADRENLSQLATNDEEFRSEIFTSSYQELQSLLSKETIKQAIAVASISLVNEFQLLQQGSSRKAERTYSRLLRYIIRMCTRPTPFGLFAGITWGTFADQSQIQLASPAIQRFNTRLDMGWLLSIVKQGEQLPQITTQLQLTTNPLCQIRGGRVFLSNANIYGQSNISNPSLRATPPVLYALECARQPIHCVELVSRLTKSFPRATQEQLDSLLHKLWENHFLLSDLLPPFSHENPVEYTLDRLRSMSGLENVANVMQSIRAEIETFNHTKNGNVIHSLHKLASLGSQLISLEDQQPFHIDSALSVKSVRLNHEIGNAAVQAAELLLRLSRFSQGLPHLQQYLNVFVEKYGLDQEVPVLDLLSSEKGLDAPPTYENPPRTYPFLSQLSVNDQMQRLDTILYNLIIEAVNEKRIEVELTNEVVQQLEQWQPKPEDAPLSLEIYLHIAASSRKALDRGEWKAVIGPNCGSMSGGRSFGRFFDLFREQEKHTLQQFFLHEEALAPDRIFAEVSYLPASAHSANVMIHPGVRTYEIPIGTTPSVPLERIIRLDDLVVGVRNNRFYIRSLRLGKEIHATQSHMLNPRLAPNVGRFLLEVTQAKTVCLTHFNWGLAFDLPFLPRLVRGKIVLLPAQWRLRASTILPTGAGSDDVRWFVGLQLWRTKWNVPRYVYLTSADNRLLLDLKHPFMAKELQTELKRLEGNDTVVLTELLPGREDLWLEDETGAKYFSEIVVPLLRTDAPHPSLRENASEALATKAFSHSNIISQSERNAFPGSSWIYIKLYVATHQQDALIIDSLHKMMLLLQQQGKIDRWFYIRYCDSAPHLRIRLHIDPSYSDNEVLTEMLNWSRQLVEKEQITQFSLDTYEREIERYGGPRAIDIIEHFFMVDSTIVSNLIAAHHNQQLSIETLDLAVFSLDSLFADWGFNLTDRLHWLQQYTQRYEAGKDFHRKQKRLCDLLLPWEHTHDTTLLSERTLLCHLVALRQPVLAEISRQIYELDRSGELWQPVEYILRSLAHMHINRLLGVNHQQEQHIYALWRQTLETLYRREQRKAK